MAQRQTPQVNDWVDVQDWQDVEAAAPQPVAPAAKPSLWQTIRRQVGAEVQPMVEAGKGFLQGAANIPTAGVQWAADIPRQIQEAATGETLPSRVPPTPLALQPRTPMEKLGQMGAGMAAQAGLAALTGGASLPAQVAAGGIGSGLIAAGTDAGDVGAGVASGVGMAAPVIGAATRAAVPMLRKGAQERIASAIGPSGQEKQELARVLPAITKGKPFAWSSESLLQKFSDDAEKIAVELDAVIDQYGPGRTIKMNGVAAKMNRLIDALKIDGKLVTPEAQKAAANIRQVQGEIRELGRVTRPYQPLPISNIAPPPSGAAAQLLKRQTIGGKLPDVRRLKQHYGDIVAGAQEHFFKALPPESRATAAKQGFYRLREGMIDAVPEAEKLGQEYSKYATPRDILQRGEYRNIAGRTSGIGRVAEAGAVAGGIVTGRPAAVAAGAILAALLKFTSSTPYKLASANLRTSLANAIESGNVTLATQIAGQILGRPFSESGAQ